MQKSSFSSGKRYLSYGNSSPSPDGRENPFVPGFGTKDWKEQRDQLLIKNKFQIFKIQIPNSNFKGFGFAKLEKLLLYIIVDCILIYMYKKNKPDSF
jgi:hypothetical protein